MVPRPGAGLDLPAYPPTSADPLPHPEQAQPPPGRVPSIAASRVEAPAVVLDDDRDVVRRRLRIRLTPAGPGVLRDVGQRLLDTR